MLRYRSDLKAKARILRKHMTMAERKIWSRLRGKQLLDTPFYRQKPIGNHIVDFYAPRAGLVVEVDGSQHKTPEHAAADERRDRALSGLGLRVLQFDSRQALKETGAVMERIHRAVAEGVRVKGKSP